MFQQQEQQQSSKGDSYETPSAQIVHLEGTTGVEVISMPMLQRYFNNVNSYNNDFAYYSVNYSEIPTNDSLFKTIGDLIVLQLEFIMYRTDYVLDAVSYVNDGSSQVYGETIRIQLSFKTQGIKTIDELLQRINMKIAEAGLRSAAWLNPGDPPIPWKSDRAAKQIFSFFNSFLYDPLSTKLVCKFTKPFEYDSIKEVPVRFVVRIKGPQTDRAGELCKAMFGGVDHDDGLGNTWMTEFDTRFTSTFIHWLLEIEDFQILAQTEQSTTDAISLYASMVRGVQALIVHSINTPRMFIEPRIYLRGAPVASIWNKDGTSTDYIMVIPRNKLPNGIPDTSAYIASEGHDVKTSLASLRNMTLRLTDSKGRPILIDEPYIIDVIISFKL